MAWSLDMDLYRIIRELVQERDRVERIILSLENMANSPNAPFPATGKRRGRKSMDREARQQVSERMKRYWADRRASKNNESKGGEESLSSAGKPSATSGATAAS
jgi:hypothetical protein